MLEWTLQEILLYTLLMFRCAGLMLITPFFGSTVVPVRVRLMFSMVMAFVLMATMPRTFPEGQIVHWTLSEYFITVIGEMTIGAAMAVVSLTLFSAFLFAGQIIDQTIGLSITQSIDPSTRISGTVTGQLHYYLIMTIFLLMDGHLYLLEVFMESVSRVPLGFVMVDANFIHLLGNVFASAFEITVKFAAPVLFLSLLVNVVLGFVSRAVPSMNVFILGFPLKILMGLGLLMLVLGQAHTHTEIFMKKLIDANNEVLETIRDNG